MEITPIAPLISLKLHLLYVESPIDLFHFLVRFLHFATESKGPNMISMQILTPIPLLIVYSSFP